MRSLNLNVRELAEKLDIIVYIADLPEKVKGLYGATKDGDFIALNSRLTETEQEEMFNEIIQKTIRIPKSQVQGLYFKLY